MLSSSQYQAIVCSLLYLRWCIKQRAAQTHWSNPSRETCAASALTVCVLGVLLHTSFCLDPYCHGLKAHLLGVVLSPKDVVYPAPGCTIAWARHSTWAHGEDLQQTTLCIRPRVSSQLLMPPCCSSCSSHQLLCACFIASHWGLLPQLRPLEGQK